MFCYKSIRFFATNKRPPPFKVLFFGSDAVSKSALDIIIRNTGEHGSRVISHLEIVCPKSLPELKNPVNEFAEKYNVPVHHIEDSIKQWKVPVSSIKEPFDLALIASFGSLLPDHVIDKFTFGGLNMHPSLLPKYRGAAPIYHTLMNGDTETGVSIIDLSRGKFDVGKIFKQIRVPVDPLATFNPLSTLLAHIGGKLLVETLQNFWEYKENAMKQPEEGVSLAPKLSKEDGIIRWKEQKTDKIWNTWRALSDTFGVTTFFRPPPLNETHKEQPMAKIFLTKMMKPGPNVYPEISASSADLFKPGMIIYDKKQDAVFVKTIDGWIGIKEFHVDSKRKMAAGDFANGYRFRKVKTAEERFVFVENPIQG